MESRHGNELQADLETLREGFSGLAGHLTEALGAVSAEVSGDVRSRMQKLGGDIDRAISDASSKGQQVARKMSPDNVGGAIESSMREHPFAALAIAVGVGALVGSRLGR
jgi:ElaB/YqjD/DUF883 family membrane-anchored ribosome-binding protein